MTDDEIEKALGDWLRKRIAKTWQRIRARVFGVEGLTDAEREAIGPIPAGEEPVIETAFRAERGSDEPLNAEEQLALEAARERAGELITGLAERHGDEAARVLEDVRAEVGASIEARDVPKVLAANMREVAGDRMRDWDRVAVTELQAAKNEGRIAAIKRTSDVDDPIVYKIPAPDACSHCVRLHLGPDGLPRLYRLSTLDANNAGRKKADWRAVRGPTHPSCSCVLATVPRGWGFDETGDLVPGGELGTVYDGADAIAKALEDEDTIQRAALVGGSVDFQGIPITVEANAGDVRRWRCPMTGKTGRTVLRYAYGEIPGTRGADGDALDVFVGPDPTSPNVYVVDQKRADGSFDEQKILVGFRHPNAAEAAYLAHYPREFMGALSELSIDDLRAQIAEPDPDGLVKSSEYRRSTPRADRGWLLSGNVAPRNMGEVVKHTAPKVRRTAVLEIVKRRQEQHAVDRSTVVPVVRIRNATAHVTRAKPERPRMSDDARAALVDRNLQTVENAARQARKGRRAREQSIRLPPSD